MSAKTKLTLAYLDQVPGSAARALQTIPAEEASAFLETVPARIAAPVLNEMITWHAARQLELLPAPRAAMVLRQLAFADATTLVRSVRSQAREPIFQALPTKYARRLEAALRYSPHQVGAWIDPQVPALSLDATVADALRVLRAAESASHIFVEAEDHEAYLGTIAVREILRAAHSASLGELRIDRATPLSNRASLASVTFDARWDEFLHLPVVNRRGSLLGGLSRKTLRQSLHEHAFDPGHRRHSLLYHLVGAYLVTCSSLSAMIGRSLSSPTKTPQGAGPNDH